MTSATSPLKAAYGRFKSIMFATIVFSFFANLLMFVGPLYMLQIYDRVLASRNELTLIMITAIAVMLLTTYGFLEFIRSKMLVRAGVQFDNMMASSVFNRAVRKQLASPNTSANTLFQDVNRVREFMTGQGILSFFDAPWVPLFLLLCFAFHPWLGIVASIGALIIFALAIANEFLTRSVLQDAGAANSGAMHFASTTMQNAEVIRALGMERPLSRRWLQKHDEFIDAQARASGRAGAIVATSKFVRMSLQVAILGVGAYLVLQQEISAGIMIAASIVMGRALAPVEQAVGQWKQMVGARQAHRRLKDIFDAFSSEDERTALPTPKGRVTVENLFGTAPGTKTALLKSVSFQIEPGEVLVLIGPSGSGKSTLVRHLVGAMRPLSGAVRLDGSELQHWDQDQLGAHMGYMPQDVKLFRGSVAENIARFIPDATDEEIVAAATLSGAHTVIQGLSDNYNTDVGDGGNALSGGQRQRIGLARAVFREPSLVVLDEPNSNLDAHGEKALAQCIQELKRRGKTVILVTHKVSFFSLSDKVLMLKNGSVERFGPSHEILAQLQKKADGRTAGVVKMADRDAELPAGGAAPL